LRQQIDIPNDWDIIEFGEFPGTPSKMCDYLRKLILKNFQKINPRVEAIKDLYGLSNGKRDAILSSLNINKCIPIVDFFKLNQSKSKFYLEIIQRIFLTNGITLDEFVNNPNLIKKYATLNNKDSNYLFSENKIFNEIKDLRNELKNNNEQTNEKLDKIIVTTNETNNKILKFMKLATNKQNLPKTLIISGVLILITIFSFIIPEKKNVFPTNNLSENKKLIFLKYSDNKLLESFKNNLYVVDYRDNDFYETDSTIINNYKIISESQNIKTEVILSTYSIYNQYFVTSSNFNFETDINGEDISSSIYGRDKVTTCFQTGALPRVANEWIDLRFSFFNNTISNLVITEINLKVIATYSIENPELLQYNCYEDERDVLTTIKLEENKFNYHSDVNFKNVSANTAEGLKLLVLKPNNNQQNLVYNFKIIVNYYDPITNKKDSISSDKTYFLACIKD